jgi:hypothetical protein
MFPAPQRTAHYSVKGLGGVLGLLSQVQMASRYGVHMLATAAAEHLQLMMPVPAHGPRRAQTASKEKT